MTLQDKKLKKFNMLRKIALTFMITGIAMMMISIVIAAIRTDILCGISVSGLFLTMIGIAVATIDSNKRKNKEE